MSTLFSLLTQTGPVSYGVLAALILLCAVLESVFLKRFFKARLPYVVLVIAVTLSQCALQYFTDETLPVPFIMMATFAVNFLLYRLVLKASSVTAMFVAACDFFHLVCLRGAMLSVFSLLRKQNLYQILQRPGLHRFTVLMAYVVLALVIGFYLALARGKVKKMLVMFFDCPKQLFSVTLSHLMLGVYVLYTTYNYYYNLDLVWFTVAQLLTCVLMLALYLILLWYGMRTAQLMLEETRAVQLSDQMRRQEIHYRTLRRTKEQLSMFLHDYREFFIALRYELDAGNIDAARRLVERDEKALREKLPVQKEYSNEPQISAMLAECAAVCEEMGAQFTARVYIPGRLAISGADLHRVMFGLLQNAQEGCAKRRENRFISVTGGARNGWATIVIHNSYGGRIMLENGRPVSTKKGMQQGSSVSFNSMMTTVENSGGLMMYTFDKQERTFTVTLQLQYDMVSA